MCQECGIDTPEGRIARQAQRQRHQKRIFGSDFMAKVEVEAEARNPEVRAKYDDEVEYEVAMKMAMESDPEFASKYWEDSEITAMLDGSRVFVVWYKE